MEISLGKIALAVIAAGLPFVSVDACTAILVGKKASATGSVLVGHNLDTSGALCDVHEERWKTGDVLG